MNSPEQSEQRILVIANRTCPCDALADEVAARARDASVEVLVVAPALNSFLRHLASDTDAAVIRAQERVNRAVAQLRNRGLSVRGYVGDTNPMLAIEDALADYSATEIVIATHPPGHSHWLERGLIEKARARFDVPVSHVVSSYGLEDAAFAAAERISPVATARSAAVTRPAPGPSVRRRPSAPSAAAASGSARRFGRRR